MRWRDSPAPQWGGLSPTHMHTQSQATGKDSEDLEQEIQKNVGLREGGVKGWPYEIRDT